MSGRDFVREIPVDFSSSQSRHEVLATLWARTRVDDLMSRDFKGAQQGNMQDDVKQAIINLGLNYRLMTQFTSFVAVEEMIVTDGGTPRRIDVPIEMPEGVSREGVFGKEEKDKLMLAPRQAVTFSGGISSANTVSAKMASAPLPSSSPSNGRTKSKSSGSAGSGNVSARPMVMADEAVAIRKLSPEDERRQELLRKLHL